MPLDSYKFVGRPQDQPRYSVCETWSRLKEMEAEFAARKPLGAYKL